jgi:hypothetical protein
MLTDWFAGKEIATAMAIFVNSWPAGVAISLLLMPLIGTSYGVSAVHLSVAAFSFCCMVLLAVAYRSPEDAAVASTTSLRLDRNGAAAMIAAGLIWGLFNVGFAVIFSSGGTRLVDRGGRFNHQHRLVARGDLGSAGRLCCGSDQTTRTRSGRKLHRVRDTDDSAAAQ